MAPNLPTELLETLNRYGLQDNGELTSGNIYFLDSAATETLDKLDGIHGKSWGYPFATLDFAVSQCADNKFDIIYVAARHAEAFGTAGLLNFDKIGVTIIGLGRGNLRPTFTIGTSEDADALADVDVDAAEVTVKNVIFKVAAVNIAEMIDVNAVGFTLEDCELVLNVASYEAVIGIDINGGGVNACDRTTIKNCKFTATLTSGTDTAIELGEVADRVIIENCSFWGDYVDAPIHNPGGKILTDLLIKDCVIENDNSSDTFCIELVSDCTGYLIGNRYKSAITQATASDPGNCFSIECYHCDVIDKSGILSPGTT